MQTTNAVCHATGPLCDRPMTEETIMHSTICGNVVVSLLGDVFGLPIRVVETARHDDPKEGTNVIDEGGVG